MHVTTEESSEKGEVLKSPSDAIVEGHQPMEGYWNSNIRTIKISQLIMAQRKKKFFFGLIKQGATCYMNSLLQTLYHLPFFRKAVYHMPTSENDFPSSRIPLALQRLFYELQTSNTAVATKQFTESLELTPDGLLVQQDAQEFSRILFEKLEPKMKETVVEDKLNQFEGHIKSSVKCINIDWTSTTTEPYHDIQLDVIGCKDIYDSFDKYVEVESLTGDNKYRTEQHGLQDVEKALLFIDFPPVLQLHLKRYELVKGQTVKLNDRHEFPLQLDLDSRTNYMPQDAVASACNLSNLYRIVGRGEGRCGFDGLAFHNFCSHSRALYETFQGSPSVLVHRGNAGGGHYYVYIRPTLGEQWYKFEDDTVTEVPTKWTLEELYGGEQQYSGEEELPHENAGFNSFGCSNAYMLVYIRESDKERLFFDVDEKDFPEHLRGSMATQGLTSDSTPSDGTTLLHRSRDAPQNVTRRLRRRESENRYAGFFGRRKDSQFVYSNSKGWKYLVCEQSHPTSVSFLGEKTHIAIGNNAGVVTVHDFRKNKDIATYQAHENKVSMLDSYYSGNTELILSSTGHEVLLWDSVAERGKHRSLNCTVGRFSSNRTMFSSSSLPSGELQKAYLMNIETNDRILTINDLSMGIQPPSEVHFNKSDNMLLWRGKLWDRRSSNMIHPFLPNLDWGRPDFWGGGFPPARVNEVIVNECVFDIRNYSLLHSVPSFEDRITFNVDNNVIYVVMRFGGFSTVDAVIYSDIATHLDVPKILSFSVHRSDTFIGYATKCRATLFEVGNDSDSESEFDSDSDSDSDS